MRRKGEKNEEHELKENKIKKGSEAMVFVGIHHDCAYRRAGQLTIYVRLFATGITTDIVTLVLVIREEEKLGQE